jgi:hypothetical protein
VPFIYITRLASNETFPPSNKIHREVGRATDLSAPRYRNDLTFSAPGIVIHTREKNQQDAHFLLIIYFD